MTAPSANWAAACGLADHVEPEELVRLARLRPVAMPRGTVLFRPGDEPAGFVIVLSGRVCVHLVGRNGRDMLLYTVEPGETCIQTTVGLVGGQCYGGEGRADTDVEIVSISRGEFSRLLSQSPGFRQFVFRAFGERLADVTRLLEQVAFLPIDQRLAACLLDVASEDGQVEATHQELARRIGSAREVVSRKLEAFARSGLVSTERGQVTLLDRARLARIRNEI